MSVLPRVLGTAVAVAVLAATPITAFDQARAVAAPVTVDDLYTALNVRDVPAEYVILVDVSASMQRGVDLYTPVKRHLRAFLAHLAEVDHVTVIPFAEARQTDRIVEGQVGRYPDRLLAGLPKTADGVETDMGTAMVKAVARLNRPNRPRIAAVFMLTDGQHTTLATSSSAYPTTSGRQWNRLRDAADKMIANKQHFSAYFTLLGRNASGRTGRDCAGYSTVELSRNPFCGVFRAGRALAPATLSDLDERLSAPRTAVMAAKVRATLGDEVNRPVPVRWSVPGVRLVDGAAVEDADVRVAPGDAPDVAPAAVALQLLGVRLLARLDLVGLLGRHVGREADLHLGHEEHQRSSR